MGGGREKGGNISESRKKGERKRGSLSLSFPFFSLACQSLSQSYIISTPSWSSELASYSTKKEEDEEETKQNLEERGTGRQEEGHQQLVQCGCVAAKELKNKEQKRLRIHAESANAPQSWHYYHMKRVRWPRNVPTATEESEYSRSLGRQPAAKLSSHLFFFFFFLFF